MAKEEVKCPICGGSTNYVEKGKKQKYICQNVECSTKLVKDKDLIFMDETRMKESEVWEKYRYKRLTLEEVNIIAAGERILDKEHKDTQEGLEYTEKKNKTFKSKKEEFAYEGVLCPFSWIEVTKPAGCLSSMFGGQDKLVWEAQPCMGSKCKLWDVVEGNCGLISKKS